MQALYGSFLHLTIAIYYFLFELAWSDMGEMLIGELLPWAGYIPGLLGAVWNSMLRILLEQENHCKHTGGTS